MDVLMPQLGETVDEGTVAQWHKNVGEHVEVDEILLDVETDKTSMEIPAPAAGTLKAIRVEAGQTVAVGTVLAVIDNGDGATCDDADGAGRDDAHLSAESTETGAAADSSSDGARTENSDSGADGSSEGGDGDGAGAGAGAGARAGAGAGARVPRGDRKGEQRLSPAVRRLVAENDINPERITGSGRDGRITRRDVLEHLAAGSGSEAETGAGPGSGIATGSGAESKSKSAAEAKSDARQTDGRTTRSGEGDLIPFNRIRRLTADHMVRSKTTSPHVLQAVEVDFSAVQQVRHQMRDAWRARHHFSLTWLPFIAHAVCRALAEFPHLNASVEDEGLRLHPHVNLAIAVDLGPAEGLVAPVIRHAEGLSVEKLAHSIYELSQNARAGRLKPDDLSGGTYTLSNSGSFGTLITAPIINQPQVAILSTDGIRKRPVVLERPDGDAIAIRPIGILAQSFDHRAVDGAYSAAFLARVSSLLELSNWTVEI